MGCDIHWHTEKKINDKWEHDPNAPEFTDRNYLLFSILAGVRNYENIMPILPPRGVPVDMSEGVAKEYKEWAGDAHTPSWLSLGELLTYDWNAEITQSGMVDFHEYIKFKKNGEPTSWARGIFGPKHITNEEMDAVIASKSGGANYCTTITWTASSELTYFYNFLKELSDYVGNTETRIVFWFDN